MKSKFSNRCVASAKGGRIGMNMKNITKAVLLILVLCAMLAATACKRSGADDARNDITVNLSDNQPGGAAPPDREPYIDVTEVVPIPERHLPFQPIDEEFVSTAPVIRMIEINQCLSYGFDTETGDFYLMENFVAGKDTAIFIDFAEPFDLSGAAVLTIERDGVVVTQLSPAGIPDDHTLLFQPRDMSDVDYWQAGAYTFTFEMDGGRAVRSVNFYETASLKILAVPMISNYNGRVVACEGEWMTASEMLISTYPVARANVEYVLGPEIDLSDSRYDLYTLAGHRRVWEALLTLQTPDNEYTLIVGYTREYMYDPEEDGWFGGYTYGMPANIVTEGTPELLNVLPHEVAHCYNVGDEYHNGGLNPNVNVAPYMMSGHLIWTLNPLTMSNPLVLGGPSVGLKPPGSVIYAEQRPYWVYGGFQLGNATTFMGSGGLDPDPYTRWISSEIYNHLFKALVNPGFTYGYTDFSTGADAPPPEYWGQCPNCYGDVFDPNFYVECWECCEFIRMTGRDFQCSSCESNWNIDDYENDLYMECPECRYYIWYSWFEEHNSGAARFALHDAQGATQGATQGEYTSIKGYIEAESGAFIPSLWYTYESSRNVVTPAYSSEYGVYTYDASGALLSVTYFNVVPSAQYWGSEGSVMVELDMIPVSTSVRLPASAARIDIKHGVETIFSQNVSRNAPTVTFTGLSDNQQLSDNATLTWDAYDADGDEIYFDIWYHPRDGQSFNLASGITGRSLSVDLSELPGTNDGYFHIYATDGVRTTEADSPSVRVPYKAPIIVTDFEGVPEFKLSDEIWIDVEVYDLQEGWLWSNESDIYVVWTGWEHLTYNMLWVLPFELPPGLHTVPCTVTNSAGLTTTRDFTFRILDESDLPDDWSSDEMRIAMSHGFALPINRPDAPVTRGEFARMMAHLYIIVARGSVPFNEFYVEGAITDCGMEWAPALMDYLGLMTATDGLFNPGGTLTERDAAVIMYNTYALALNDPDVMSGYDNESGIVRVFTELGILNADGPNVYDESARMTYRLTLVRLNRFYDAIYS